MPDEHASPTHAAIHPAPDLSVAAWHDRLALVRARVNEATVAAGRAPADVHLLPTVKYVDAQGVTRLVAAGATDLAENRLDALEIKQAAVGELLAAHSSDSPALRPPLWHYIGRVQSKQVVEIARRVDMIHSLASPRAFARLATAAANGLALPSLLVQVNAANDPAKDGVALDSVEQLLTELPAEIRIAGFMTMPAFATDPEQSRPAFAALCDLRDRLAPAFVGRHDLQVLSMGTTQDLDVAIAEGATHVRLGRILFSDAE